MTTGALIGLSITLAGCVAALIAALFWSVKVGFDAKEEAKETLDQSHAFFDELKDAQHEMDIQSGILRELKERTEREISARKTVEDYLEEAISDLSKMGEPNAVAYGMRLDLERLRDLVPEVPEVPEAGDSDDG